MSTKQPNKPNYPSTEKSSDPMKSQRQGALSTSAQKASTGSSTKATNGSASFHNEDPARYQGVGGSSQATSGQSWALGRWLEQGPRDEPWNKFSGGRQ